MVKTHMRSKLAKYENKEHTRMWLCVEVYTVNSKQNEREKALGR
jgi:hypothetical protein